MGRGSQDLGSEIWVSDKTCPGSMSQTPDPGSATPCLSHIYACKLKKIRICNVWTTSRAVPFWDMDPLQNYGKLFFCLKKWATFNLIWLKQYWGVLRKWIAGIRLHWRRSSPSASSGTVRICSSHTCKSGSSYLNKWVTKIGDKKVETEERFKVLKVFLGMLGL